MDAITGAVVWEKKVAQAFTAAPVFFSDKLYIGSDAGVFIALNAADGSTLWVEETDGQIAGNAAISLNEDGESLVVFGSYDGFLRALSTETGELRWQLKADNYINGNAILAGGMLLFGSCDSNLYVLNTEGSLIRKVDSGSHIPASPAAAGSRSVIMNYAGRVLAIDISTGEIVWENKDERTPSFLSPAINQEKVVCVDERGVIRCLESENGNLVWRKDTGSSIEGFVAIWGVYAVFGTAGGRFEFLSMQDGSPVFEVDIGGVPSGYGAAGEEWFFSTAESGELRAFTVNKEFARLWSGLLRR